MNSIFTRFILFLIGTVLIVGCSSIPKSTLSEAKTARIVQIAKSQIGRPYHYGGQTPKTGFDCSGLVQYSFKRAGTSLPRTTLSQYKFSHPVARDSLQPGDLVFFRINRLKISHVGIYIGNARFVHAPSKGKKVTIANLNDRYWHKRFLRGGRI